MNDLLKELKLGALDWKGFLLAGLSPVVVFWFGAILCLQGPHGVEATLAGLFAKPSVFVANSASFVCACLIAGVVLYAIRPITLDFFRRMPVRWIHAWRIKRWARKREDADKSMWNAVWEINVARWFQSEFPIQQFVHPAILKAQESVELASTLVQSRTARSHLIGATDEEWTTNEKEVFAALRNLHVLAGRRTRIEDQAFKLAQERQATNEQNWAASESFWGWKAPDATLSQELTEWRQIYHASALAQTRIRNLESYVLHDRHRKCAVRLSRFPSGDWIEPTRLGNILAGLEDYAESRYGMDTSLLWSRLEMTVPKEQREQITNYQRALNAMLHLNVAFMALAIFALILSSLRAKWSLLWFAAGAVIAAYLCLKAAGYSAGGLRAKIEASVDLNILRWLRSMGVTPTDAAARLLALQQLCAFLNGGTPLPGEFRFAAVTEPAPESKKKEK